MLFTNKEAILGVINYPLPGFENAIHKALVDHGLEVDHFYIPDYARDIDLAAADLILFVLTAPTSISDLGFSINVSKKEELLAIRSLILAKHGLVDDYNRGSNSITDGSFLWG